MLLFRKVIFLFWFTSLSGVVIAQKGSFDQEVFLHNSAQDFIVFEDYESALSVYHTLDSLKPDNPLYVFNIGLCTFHSSDKPNSLLYFLRAHNLGYQQKELYYYMAQSYQFNYDMDNAIYYLDKYTALLDPLDSNYEKQHKEVDKLREQIVRAGNILSKGLSVNIENVGGAVNSPFADYVPITLFKDSVLIFTSRRHESTGRRVALDGHHYEDIYFATKNDKGEWQEAVHLPGLNSKNHDAVVAVNYDETELYIYKAKRGGDIYKSVKSSNGNWSKPRPLKEINTKHWEGSLCLSADGNTLYFSSDRPGGFGESDLYSATKDQQGRWSNITNMGPTINTPLDEDAPYIYKDNKTFFFSSKGHNSIGGYDVFSTKLVENMDSLEIKNLGFPINTVDHDIYFQLNSQASIGYFTSQRYSNFREQSIGEKDIFQIKRPHSSPVYFIFKGRVHDPESKEPLPAIVTLKDLDDASVPVHKLATDINSGKFRYDLKFENRYNLTVEIGDKVYYSKELYFPYQPDLFETFIDIPLKDIPRYKVNIKDVLQEADLDVSGEVRLDDDPAPTIVLVRKVPYNDPALRDLLSSGKIPVAFRKKLLKQLEGTPYLDDPEEGWSIKQLFEEYSDDDTPIVFTKLEGGEVYDIKRLDIKSVLSDTEVTKPGSKGDSIVWNNLSEEEKNAIQRLTEAVLTQDVEQLVTFDEVYFKSLSEEEGRVVNRLVAMQVMDKLKRDSLHQYDSGAVTENLCGLIDHVYGQVKSKNLNVKTFSKEAWGLLYTIETSRFRHGDHERITFSGRVTHRSKKTPAPQQKLLITDDSGMIYAQVFTTDDGRVEFKNLLPGKRYHVLIDDYAIAILGQSRYQLEYSIQSNEEDYLKFYDSLTPEQKRAIDRIVARQLANSHYQTNPIKAQEDNLEFAKLSQQERDFINRVRNYLMAKKMADSAFYMQRNDAYWYEQMNTDMREEYNRFIASKVSVSSEDSIFYASLSAAEKGYINLLRDSRKARKVVVEDIMVSGADSDYWYVLDEITTAFGDNKSNVQLSARIAHKVLATPGKIQIALMDEFNQIIHLNETDSAGFFRMLSVKPNRRFKVLINKGGNIGDLKDYSLTDLKFEGSDGDFYEDLTPTERRIIDRIIATNLANESYKKNASLLLTDDKFFEQLSVEDRELLVRLKEHLFADTVTVENARLHREVNHYYYSNLSFPEREFINRYMVKSYFGEKMDDKQFPLKRRDKMFYNSLSEKQKQFIGQLQGQRKAKADMFAENPVLLVEKAWVVLDSVSVDATNGRRYSVSGKIVDKNSLQPINYVPVMLSTDSNEIEGIMTADSVGNFKFKTTVVGNKLYVLAETKRNLFKNESNLKVVGLTIETVLADAVDGDDDSDDDKISTPQDKAEMLVVYFDFNSAAINPTALKALQMWLAKNADELSDAIFIVHGHTDSVGGDAYNQALSERRSMVINDYLVRNGINHAHIVSRGFGEKQPRYSSEMDYLNRRVEIRAK
jgi:outer membrane protein OmpA-like peptidoglycan-associated protein